MASLRVRRILKARHEMEWLRRRVSFQLHHLMVWGASGQVAGLEPGDDLGGGLLRRVTGGLDAELG
jgi:hypothetical protein